MSSIKTSGLGIGSVLGIVFVVLKLTGLISWSWIWVLAPFWISLALFILLLITVVIFQIITDLV